jgi:hypothetical protein
MNLLKVVYKIPEHPKRKHNLVRSTYTLVIDLCGPSVREKRNRT